MRRAVVGTARAIEQVCQENGRRYRAAMVTLTYRPGEQWEPRDISKLCKHYRMWAIRRGIRLQGVWVLELTKAGVPHYHLLLFVPRGYTPPLPDKQGWWRKGCTNAKWCRSAVGYVAKYASKGGYGDLPAGARLHGHIGLSARVWAMRSWHVAPGWLRRMVPFGHRIKRVEGWWRNCEWGIEYRSPWVMDSLHFEGAVIRWQGWTPDDIRFVV